MARWFGIVALALVVWWLVSRARHYGRLYAAAHLVELARGLDELRQTPPAAEEAPPAHFISSAGLAVAHGWRALGDSFAHHLSLSLPSGLMAGGAAMNLMMFLLERLGVDPMRADVATSAQFVTHASFRLSPAEHEALLARPIALAPGEARAALRQAMAAAVAHHTRR